MDSGSCGWRVTTRTWRNRVVPLSPKMVGLRFQAAVPGPAGVERVTGARRPTDVMLEREVVEARAIGPLQHSCAAWRSAARRAVAPMAGGVEAGDCHGRWAGPGAGRVTRARRLPVGPIMGAVG